MGSIRNQLAKWSDKTKLAIVGSGYVMKQWRYACLALAIALVFAFILTMVSAGSTDAKLLFSSISILDKLAVLGAILAKVFTNLTSLSGVANVMLSLLQGVTIALLVFNFKKQRKFDSESAADSGIVSIIAILGAGCGSCGTSLLMPIVTIIFSSSAYIVVEIISSLITIIAFLLVLYAARRLGLMSYTTITAERHRKAKNER